MSHHVVFSWLNQWPWLALFLLGAFHGVNPAMGWLFAVSLGLQQRRRAAVLSALPQILLGHLLSVSLIVGLLQAFRMALPAAGIRVAAALILVGFGALRLWRSRHPRWVGMQVGFHDLTVWSFLMASAHGAGLMLMPFLLVLPGAAPEHLAPEHLAPDHLMNHAGMAGMDSLGPAVTAAPSWLLPVGVHTFGYLLVLSLIALVVYDRLGLAILRRAWINLDVLWAAALVGTGILTLFL
jgi:hypothetical protein